MNPLYEVLEETNLKYWHRYQNSDYLWVEEVGKYLLERNTREFSWCPVQVSYKNIYIYWNHQTVYTISERKTERERRQDMEEKEREREWVQFSLSVLSTSLWPHGLQPARLPSPSPTPAAYSNSCPSSRWCHPTISSSVIPFSSCLQSFPASGSFPVSQFFTSGGQSM